MIKLSNEFKVKREYDGILTNSFRELVKEQLGELDTATSFMYLYRRFGEPTQYYLLAVLKA